MPVERTVRCSTLKDQAPTRPEPTVKVRLHLPQVTLCAATSVNLTATLQAMKVSMAQIEFGACKLFTDVDVIPDNPAIEIVRVAPLRSSADYSAFMLTGLADHIETSHALVVQWDGHVLDAQRWRHEFLNYDYIGASWPQFCDDHNVGNGGFSLRSRQLLHACCHDGFHRAHPEDVAIGRLNRPWLESLGLRFAPQTLADCFSTERAGDLSSSFGYHGLFNMPRAIGVSAFWNIYRTLDERGTLRHDLIPLLRDVASGQGGFRRGLKIASDRAREVLAQGLARIPLRWQSRPSATSSGRIDQ